MQNLTKKILATLVATALVLASLPTAEAADVTRTGTAGDLDAVASWSTVSLPTSADIAVWATSSATTGNIGINQSWSGIRMANGTLDTTIGATAGQTLTLGASGINMTAATGDLTIECALATSAAQAWQIAVGRTLTLSGTSTLTDALTLGTTGGGNNYDGAVTIATGGAYTVNGLTRVSSGTLTVASGGTFTATASTRVDALGTLTVASGGTYSGLSFDNYGTANVAGTATFSSVVDVFAGSTLNVSGTMSSNVSGLPTSAALIVGTIGPGNSGTVTISSGGSYTASGTTTLNEGTLTVASGGTFTANGDTRITQGTLIVDLGGSFSGTSLTFNDSSNKADTANIAGTATFSSAVSVATGGTLNVSGTMSGTTLNVGTTTAGNSGTVIISSGGNYTASGITTVQEGTLTVATGGIFNGTSLDTHGTIVNHGTINNSGVLEVSHGGTLSGTGRINGLVAIGVDGSANLNVGRLNFAGGLNVNSAGVTVNFSPGDLGTVSGGTLAWASVGGRVTLNINGSGWTKETDAKTLLFDYTGAGFTGDTGLTTLVNNTGVTPYGSFSLFHDTANKQIWLMGLTAIPEPSTWALLGASLLAVVIFRRRKA